MAKRVTTSVQNPLMGRRPSVGGLRSNGSPTQDQIAARAYELYCDRCQNAAPGDAVGDWLRAEDQLRRL